MSDLSPLPSSYPALLEELKGRIRAAQVRAAFAVSRELILLYWSIGRDLSQRFASEEWGGKIIDRLARDLQAEFPGVEGFSPRNLRYMRSLAEAWPDEEILQQLIAKLPWGHNLRVLDRIKDRPTREWYLRAALEFGWSQDVLVLQLKSRLHEREGKALTDFPRALPPPDSDLAEQILKDPYNFDFLTVRAAAKEREIERGLLTHLRDLLLELGRGFSFVGSQVPLTVDGQTFYIDLLFYHVRLHCYFVFELKVGAFQPEHAGKLGFYLAAVNRTMRTPVEGPSIGVLLCESRWKGRRKMKRRVCSYDMFAVPDPSFVLKDTVGEMYFCNLRCLCVWSVQLATRPNLSTEDKTGEYTLTTPSGENHQFLGIVDVARWATTTAFE